MKVMFLKKNWYILRKMSYDCSKISGLPDEIKAHDEIRWFDGMFLWMAIDILCNMNVSSEDFRPDLVFLPIHWTYKRYNTHVRVPYRQAVLWIQIRSDPELFAGSGLGFGINHFGSEFDT
jgi:hypothetical protein